MAPTERTMMGASAVNLLSTRDWAQHKDFLARTSEFVRMEQCISE